MATGKRFYWLKLKGEFMKGEEVDFLMSQPNGSDYVVLYQMLCLSTINTRGLCARVVGEALIPYDIDKIKREAKWFKRDTIIVALELYKKLGLVYEQDNGMLQISDFESLVGSETDWAQKKARQRLGGGDIVPELSPPMSPQDIRDKSLDIKSSDIRDKTVHTTTTTTLSLQDAGAGAPSREKNEVAVKGEESPPPTVSQVYAYMRGELGEDVTAEEAEKFAAWNEKFGWDCLPNWQGAVRLWCARRAERGQ